jgi:chromatin segregation and condensation protein Rec8/ScpA/Scc1 (kleisin family)
LENPAEVTNDVNFEQFGHMEDPYIPEEESRVDFEENTEEIPESQLNDEQASGEKYEEFQARRWTKRTQQLMHTLRRELKRRESIALDVLSKQESRKQVAVKFYSCLLLKRDNEVELQQKDAFGKIYVSKGPCFDSV